MKALALLVLLAHAQGARGREGFHVVKDCTIYPYVRDGREVGAWFVEERCYRPLSGGVYGLPRDTPSAVHTPLVVPKRSDEVTTVQGETVPTGVDWPVPDEEEFTLSGEKVSRGRALEGASGAFQQGIPDFGGKPWLVVIGPKDFRERVLKDVDQTDLKNKVIVRDIDPSDPKESWALECGFKTDAPQVYLQAPSGKVLARIGDYQGVGSLRKLDPEYRPEDDFDPTKAVESFLKNVPPWGYAAGGALLLFVLTRRRE